MKTNYSFKILSPAKINLCLHITGKRDDGYHELYSLMSCISLYDKLFFSFDNHGINISCSNFDVPKDNTNLAYKAAECFYNEMMFKGFSVIPSVDIYIDKIIPIGAGLGGGSSNAASVLKELNRYYGNPFTIKELMVIGLQIGADVPFFIYEKSSIATGIGEKLTFYNGSLPYFIIVVYPGFKVSTIKIFKKFKFSLTKEKKLSTYTKLQDDDFDVELHLINDLEDVTGLMHSEIFFVKNILLKNEAKGALMSGSGSSVFGIYTTKRSALSAYERISDIGKNHGWQVYLVNILN